MATVGEILASTHEFIMPKVVDSVLTGIPLLEALLADDKMTTDGGYDIGIPVVKGLPSGGRYQPYDVLTATDNDEIDKAFYPWTYYHAFPSISSQDYAKNGGKAGVVKLWTTKQMLGGMRVKNDIANDLFADPTTTDTTQAITSLEQVVTDGSTGNFTVGNLNATDIARWAGNLTSVGAAYDVTFLETAYVNCSEGDTEPTDIIFGKSGFSKHWAKIQTLQRYLERDAAVGFRNYMFNNARTYFDSHILTTGGSLTGLRAYVLNTNYMDLVIHQDFNFTIEDKNPSNQDVYAALVKVFLNLAVGARWPMGAIHNFT